MRQQSGGQPVVKMKVGAKYSITDIAREFDVTTRTVRFYEDQGLLSPTRNGRTRVYTDRERVRMKLILRGKRLGFSLSEICELFDLYDSARGEFGQLEYFLSILADRRASLEQQREDLAAVLKEIDALEKQCQQILLRQRNREPQP